MNERILSPSAPKGFVGFIARQYDLILLAALVLMIVSGVIGRNLLILRLSLVVAFNNLIHGLFPPTSQERTDERMVRIKHRAGFIAFLAAVAGMIILFTGLTFISGLGTADIYLYAWSYISFCLLVYGIIYSVMKRVL
jgi:hypothetical protein